MNQGNRPEIPGYRIEREIGRGGMATVYLAVQASLERQVALKVMKAALMADEEFAERFVREARTAASLQHPAIVSVFDAGTDGNHSFISMEFVGAGDLKARLKSGALGSVQAVAITRRIAGALHYAHEKGFVHRDVKPENILFREDGYAVLSDFGIARAIGSGRRMTATGLSIGTPHYMSPEQARGKDVDGRSDLYALGVVFFEMLTGKVPFDAQDSLAVAYQHVNDAIPSLPPEVAVFQPVIEKLLAKQPDERYQSGRALVSDLDRLDRGLAIEPPLKATRVMKKAAHGKETDHGITESGSHGSSGSGGALSGLYWGLGGAALALVVAAGIYYWQQQSKPIPSIVGGTGIIASRPTPSATEAATEAALPEPSARIAPAVVEEPLVPAAEPELPEESEPDDVLLAAQQLLNRLGFPVPETGRLDRRTEASIRAFEQEQGLVASAAVDDILMERLQGEYDRRHQAAWDEAVSVGTAQSYQRYVDAFPDGGHADSALARVAELERAELESVQLVRDIQTELARLGRAITTDGQYGPATASEIRAFEKAAGRDVGGQATPELLAALRAVDDWPLHPGDFFRGCSDCPELVVVPGGDFLMGSPDSEEGRDDDESPQHLVRISTFALARTEVTVGEFERFVVATGYRTDAERDAGGHGGCYSLIEGTEFGFVASRSWRDPGFGQSDSHPAVCVSWNDAQAYIAWLSQQTGETYRLPSEAEHEYALRAGTTTAFPWGVSVSQACSDANVLDQTATFNAFLEFASVAVACRDHQIFTAPVGSYQSNPFNVHDLAGNVWEWVEDCWNESYNGAPADGGAWVVGDCTRAVLRGGSWGHNGALLRSANRGWYPRDLRYFNVGFRVARSL